MRTRLAKARSSGALLLLAGATLAGVAAKRRAEMFADESENGYALDTLTGYCAAGNVATTCVFRDDLEDGDVCRWGSSTSPGPC